MPPVEVRGAGSDQNRMSAYLHDGRWRYQFRLELPTGKWVRKSGSAPKKHNTEAAAIKAEREHIAKLLRPEAAGSKEGMPTFEEFVPVYMKQGTLDQSPSEVEGKEQKLDKLLLDQLGELRLDQIGKLQLDGLKALLLKKELAPKTVNNYLATVSAILSYAVEAEVLKVAPRVKLLKVPKQPFEVYSDAELNQLLEEAQGDPMLRCALLLGCDAGLRAGEIRALHKINIGNGQLEVMHSCYNGKLKAPKSGLTRVVPMTPRLQAAVNVAMQLHQGDRVLTRMAAEGADGRARCRNGLNWTKESMRHIRLPKGWHALRHTFCTRLAMRGIPVTIIQALAGHSDIRVTQRYMHAAPTALAPAVYVLDDSIQEAEKRNAPKAGTKGALVGKEAQLSKKCLNPSPTTSI